MEGKGKRTRGGDGRKWKGEAGTEARWWMEGEGMKVETPLHQFMCTPV